MNDQDARLLLMPLAEEPVPPSGLDAAALVSAGRRRVRRRRLVTLGGTGALTVAALVAVPLVAAGLAGRGPAPSGPVVTAPNSPAVAAEQPVAAPPPLPTTCVAQRLPVPDGATSAIVQAADPTGRYLVGLAYSESEEWTLLWDRGRLTVLTPPTQSVDTMVVNASGVVAGSGLRTFDGGRDNEQMAWVYENGTYRRLQLVHPGPGAGVEITGINARGEVVGNQGVLGKLKDDIGVRYPLRVPVRWPAGEGSPRALPLPEADADVSAAGIADDGTVVGHQVSRDDQLSRSSDRGLVWVANDPPRELAAPGGTGPGTSASAIAGDWVVGWSQAGDGFGLSRWNLRTGAAATVDGLAFVGGVNRHGWVSGFVRAANGFETPAFAAGGKVVRLPSVDGAVPSREGPGAYTISEDGRVLSGLLVTGADERPFPVRWTCR
jgi:hypothetical protein